MARIIEYNNEYEEKTKKLYTDVLIEEFEFELFRNDILQEDLNYYMSDGGKMWLAVDDCDNVIATMAINRKTTDTVDLRKVYMHKDYRGTGLANTMFDNAIEFCKQNNYRRVLLDTYQRLGRAIGFYVKKGFKEYFDEDKEITELGEKLFALDLYDQEA